MADDSSEKRENEVTADLSAVEVGVSANVCKGNSTSECSPTTEKGPEKSSLSDDSSAKPVSSESDIDQANLHYEGDVCIYTDPVSKFQYRWDGTKNEWIPKVESVNSEDTSDSAKSEADSSVVENGSKSAITKDSGNNSTISEKDYVFDGESYIYKDSKTGVTYKFDNAKNSWVVKTELKKAVSQSDSDEEEEDNVVRQDMTAGHYSYEGDTHLYTDPSDGSVYIWDREKNAWFPKVDDDFLAHYQMNYGFTDPKPTTPEVEEKKEETAEETLALKRKLPPKEPSWFEVDEVHNTKVYVNNLPLDITEQEFVDLMQKCGLVMRDVDTGRMKVKIYMDPATNQPKGDALCSYIKVESVELALKLLDGYDLRGHKISVERAKFQMKGDYNPNLKPKKRRKKDKEKIKKMQEKLFDWRPDKLRGERSKHERVVIIKNLFDPKIFDNDVALILEYQQDLREECSKCGDVRKVVIYDRHQEGVAQVTFREAEEADTCIKLLNGRWFCQRKITAETWDGKTKYKFCQFLEPKL
ncbi:17S U2 SnRNP complex component HTATSF1 isoform X2 [Anabrus simplex]|uniref:17S U2 SnRNP complex component HTATSF1 isoform X2 n=1 Tax=Anabrus simplex TaxID=316456 RepID=UPI0035A2AC49